MMSAVTESMHERTGRTLEEWVRVVQGSGIDPLDQKTVRGWLRDEHGILQNSQWAIADAAAQAAGWKRPSVEEYIGSQYEGPKATMRPIFDRLYEIALSLGDDVSVEGPAPIRRSCGGASLPRCRQPRALGSISACGSLTLHPPV